MRILITGKNGQVGTELSRLYQSRGDVVLTGRDECDLSNEQSIQETVQRVKPTVILNAGAYTAVDQAEKEPDLCFAINAHAPRILAQEAARLDALLIHYSTDYVFDGEKAQPYLENDPIHPLNVYGESKAAGEAAIAEVPPVTWCSGPVGSMEPTERIFSAPCSVSAPSALSCASWTTSWALPRPQLRSPMRPHAWSNNLSPALPGIYHMTADGSTSWCGFARAIFDAGGLSYPAARASYLLRRLSNPSQKTSEFRTFER